MTNHWQQLVTTSLKSEEELNKALPGKRLAQPFSDNANRLFKFRVPAGFLSSVKGTSSQALLTQVIPDERETELTEGYLADPVGDLNAMQTPGLIHKYANRALFIVTGACAIHCRYCFRRHFPYSDAQINNENWEPAFAYLREHNEISEIILSGGDPLIISNEKMQQLIMALASIPHLKRLRIHSRIPSVLPERMDNELISLFTTSRFNISLVTHINHADELNEKNRKVFEHLRQTSIQMLNQSVLLAGINDSADSLIDLSEKLYENGILPYYLHMLDTVQGAAHFFVKEADAKGFIKRMTEALPGYLVPKLVREISGERAKTRIL